MSEAALRAFPETSVSDTDPMEEWEILTEVVLALVSQPKCVQVEEQTKPNESHFTIHVAPEDLGKVIGKNGETVSTLRKLFGRIAATRGRKTFIQIAEPQNAHTRSRLPRVVSSRRSAA